jgi:hypothetical protein
LNGTQLLVYFDYVNLLGININIVKKSTVAISVACEDVCLKVNTEKIKCVHNSSTKCRETLQHEDISASSLKTWSS